MSWGDGCIILQSIFLLAILKHSDFELDDHGDDDDDDNNEDDFDSDDDDNSVCGVNRQNLRLTPRIHC